MNNCSTSAYTELQIALQADHLSIVDLINHTDTLNVITTLDNSVAILPNDLIAGNRILTQIIK